MRRTFTAPNAAMRAVRPLASGSRDQMHAALLRLSPGPLRPDEFGIRRVWLRQGGTGFPRAEHLLVAAPGEIAAKQRRSFEATWSSLTGDQQAAHCFAP
ncbi:hypothetical protein [Dactylosporangium sp. CA-233914]|uniref:hypothetical protein n=1 Tax=Dactylosporangium sp. CA-233914 TaxID=3239934 RepID=UPI003D922787